MNQSMRKSRLLHEDPWFMKYDRESNVKIIKEDDITHEQGYSYRKIHQTKKGYSFQFTDEVYKDKEFQITNQIVRKIDPNVENVKLKRLIKLYPKQRINRPKFFNTQPFLIIKDPTAVPHFLGQIDIFQTLHYKSLFITQDYQDNGAYKIVINNEGRFQTELVDDLIPVYESTDQPIWGMSLEEPWKLIILKFWAKKLGGYHQVKQAKPFQFLQSFTNSNWKYFNLYRDGTYFLNYYNQNRDGKFVLKTKNTSTVRQAGLIPNSAHYQIIGIRERTNKNTPLNEKKWNILIRSTYKHKWSGSLSIVDENLNSLYDAKFYKMRLQRDFMINSDDFLNLFSSANVASIRDKQCYFTNYYLLDIPANHKRATYLEFEIKKEGFFDFVIKQFNCNKKPVQTQKSRIDHSEYEHQNQGKTQKSIIKGSRERFLKMKYMIAFDNHSEGYKYPYKNEQEKEYPIADYQIYQAQYSKGYNRGEAHFLHCVKGRYILRIKPQTYDKQSKFVIHYSSTNRLELKQVYYDKTKSSAFIRQCMASRIVNSQKVRITDGNNHQQIGFGYHFQEYGYGYIGVRSSKKNKNKIMIQIDPIKLRKQGYALKNQFKKKEQPFGIVVSPGQINAIVLKKINHNQVVQQWPPKSVGVYVQKKTNDFS